ncbi:FAD-binding oxidoreductase [Sphingomonas sp.]|jgi:FAD/FMN-containing dehydrogenase|uniref:FAD-binding oxidoreductase n=1 Tax=Sphingomonas sp. TaxID=28214 RepID=UPI002E332369|nr:FAD-binding oxidoreductase [Sphingomonas sp.]HEX4694727.1 FAD-binding oxidoreductase [Sphingomonas sp.]
MTTPAQTALIEAVRAELGDKAAITEASDIAPWLNDWRGRFHGASPAILTPDATEGVQFAVGRAHELGVALVPQGGNTSMVGGAIPPPDGSALILSLRRMNRIRSLDAEAGLAVAEAGVILQHLHEAAEAAGRRFPLTLGARGSATIGGLVSTNAGGTQVLRFGTMRSLVAGIEAVLPDGSLHDGLAALKKDNRGYDLDHLLVGAEGTLGVVTAATLRLVPAIADRATGWLGVDSPAAALHLLRAMEARSGQAIESFELVAQDTLDLVLKHIPGTRAPLGGQHRWLVLVDYVGPAPDSARESLETLMAAALGEGLAEDAIVAASEAQAEAFWRLRDSISEAERAEGPTMAHDISVPVDAMPQFMMDASARVEAAFPGVHCSAFGHLGDGNVHFHVNAPAGVDAERWRTEVGEPASHMVYDLVVAAAGSISAEHGIGQMKLAELERLSPPGRQAALRAIKRAFDPHELMNPGKLVTLAPNASRP